MRRRRLQATPRAMANMTRLLRDLCPDADLVTDRVIRETVHRAAYDDYVGQVLNWRAPRFAVLPPDSGVEISEDDERAVQMLVEASDKSKEGRRQLIALQDRLDATYGRPEGTEWQGITVEDRKQVLLALMGLDIIHRALDQAIRILVDRGLAVYRMDVPHAEVLSDGSDA